MSSDAKEEAAKYVSIVTTIPGIISYNKYIFEKNIDITRGKRNSHKRTEASTNDLYLSIFFFMQPSCLIFRSSPRPNKI